MQIFLSWSGPRSKHIALAFKSWLGLVIQSLEPWISPDIEKGARWNEELSGRLESSKIGIICLTKDNLSSPWILFEAGALSKVKADYVCTFLFDIKPADIVFPLAQFQHTENTKDDIFKLITTINGLSPKATEKKLGDSVIKTSFDTYWKQFEEQLEKTPPLKAQGEEPVRSVSDMFQEILGTLRMMDRTVFGMDLKLREASSLQNLNRYERPFPWKSNIARQLVKPDLPASDEEKFFEYLFALYEKIRLNENKKLNNQQKCIGKNKDK
jgi:hypothetical protein